MTTETNAELNSSNPYAQGRFGIFSVDTDLVRSGDRLIRIVMAKCIITKVEHLLHSDTTEYVAASEYFEPLRKGDLIPEYRWCFDATGVIYAEKVAYDNSKI